MVDPAVKYPTIYEKCKCGNMKAKNARQCQRCRYPNHTEAKQAVQVRLCKCGKPMTQKAKLCLECFRKDRMLEHNVTCSCGRKKKSKSDMCRKCYDAQRKKDATIAPCTSCGGYRSNDKYDVCSKCRHRDYQAMKRSEVKGRIQAFIAGPITLPVVRNTIIFCHYWKEKRMNILAMSLKAVRDYIKNDYGMMSPTLISSTCRISDVNVNLTGIDLSQFNGAQP